MVMDDVCYCLVGTWSWEGSVSGREKREGGAEDLLVYRLHFHYDSSKLDHGCGLIYRSLD